MALLREHGLEGEALFEFVDLILAEVLRRHGATLWDARREDLRGYLLEQALRIAATWDASEAGPRYSFRSWLGSYLRFRVLDWWRAELGDVRYPGSRGSLRNGVLNLDHVPEGAPEHPATTDDYFASMEMGSAVDTLAENLSPPAAWTVRAIAATIAEGASLTTAAAEAGTTVHRAKRLLEELRDELAGHPAR